MAIVRRAGFSAVAVALTVAVSNCGGTSSIAASPTCDVRDAMSPACTERVPQLEGEMRRFIGAARCSTDDDCRALALGTRPCGGPAEYVAYSTINLDRNAFESVTGELNRLHRLRAEALSRAGMMSDCAVVTDPGAVCQSGRCALRPQR